MEPLADTILGVTIFSGLSREDVAKILGKLEECSFAAGETIIRQGDKGDAFYLIQTGAVQVVFGSTWRIALGSMLAFWLGDFVNSYILAKLKIATQGRALWMRTIGSTVVGELVDSFVFYPIAFYGIWTAETLIKIIIFNWALKVAVEVVFTPVTYAVVNALKRAEKQDIYDVGTNFTPFSLE